MRVSPQRPLSSSHILRSPKSCSCARHRIRPRTMLADSAERRRSRSLRHQHDKRHEQAFGLRSSRAARSGAGARRGDLQPRLLTTSPSGFDRSAIVRARRPCHCAQARGAYGRDACATAREPPSPPLLSPGRVEQSARKRDARARGVMDFSGGCAILTRRTIVSRHSPAAFIGKCIAFLLRRGRERQGDRRQTTWSFCSVCPRLCG